MAANYGRYKDKAAFERHVAAMRILSRFNQYVSPIGGIERGKEQSALEQLQQQLAQEQGKPIFQKDRGTNRADQRHRNNDIIRSLEEQIKNQGEMLGAYKDPFDPARIRGDAGLDLGSTAQRLADEIMQGGGDSLDLKRLENLDALDALYSDPRLAALVKDSSQAQMNLARSNAEAESKRAQDTLTSGLAAKGLLGGSGEEQKQGQLAAAKVSAINDAAQRAAVQQTQGLGALKDQEQGFLSQILSEDPNVAARAAENASGQPHSLVGALTSDWERENEAAKNEYSGNLGRILGGIMTTASGGYQAGQQWADKHNDNMQREDMYGMMTTGRQPAQRSKKTWWNAYEW